MAPPARQMWECQNQVSSPSFQELALAMRRTPAVPQRFLLRRLVLWQRLPKPAMKAQLPSV